VKRSLINIGTMWIKSTAGRCLMLMAAPSPLLEEGITAGQPNLVRNVTLIDQVAGSELVKFLSAANVWVIPNRRKVAGVSVPSRHNAILATVRSLHIDKASATLTGSPGRLRPRSSPQGAGPAPVVRKTRSQTATDTRDSPCSGRGFQ
jgi:hypothetical protein